MRKVVSWMPLLAALAMSSGCGSRSLLEGEEGEEEVAQAADEISPQDERRGDAGAGMGADAGADESAGATAGSEQDDVAPESNPLCALFPELCPTDPSAGEAPAAEDLGGLLDLACTLVPELCPEDPSDQPGAGGDGAGDGDSSGGASSFICMLFPDSAFCQDGETGGTGGSGGGDAQGSAGSGSGFSFCSFFPDSQFCQDGGVGDGMMDDMDAGMSEPSDDGTGGEMDAGMEPGDGMGAAGIGGEMDAGIPDDGELPDAGPDATL